MRRKRILITGASGFIGHHIIGAALDKGLDVYAAIRKTSRIQHLQEYPIRYTFPEFNSVQSLKKELEEKNYDFIIHAAGTTKAKTADEYNEVNATYTYNLAKAAEQASYPLQKMIFISSLAAVGPSQNIHELITENTIPQPVTAYGKSKLLAEQKLAGITLPLLILRPTAVYGPREKDIFILFKSINRGIEPYIGNIQQQLSFVYVKDVAALAVNALFTPPLHAVYNISDGFGYSRYDLADIAKVLLHKKTWRMHLPQRMARNIAAAMEKTYGLFNKVPALNIEKLHELTARNWWCDIQKAKNELGFSPAWSLKQGLQETLEWYKQHKWL